MFAVDRTGLKRVMLSTGSRIDVKVGAALTRNGKLDLEQMPTWIVSVLDDTKDFDIKSPIARGIAELLVDRV